MKSEPLWTYDILIGDEAIEHCQSLGAVPSADGLESVVVEVVQRQELQADAVVGVAEVLVGGIRVDAENARRLARFLTAAAELATRGTAGRPAADESGSR